MRCLVHATLTNESGNALVRDPNFAERLQTVLGDLRPEAVYFAAADGQRSIYAVCDLASGVDIPRVAEPLWLAFNASVEITPLITMEEMQQVGASIGEATQKYR
jgi:hypothetical protein